MSAIEYTTCYRKKKHRTPTQADAELLRLQETASRHDLAVYFCKYCGYWHIGGQNER